MYFVLQVVAGKPESLRHVANKEEGDKLALDILREDGHGSPVITEEVEERGGFEYGDNEGVWVIQAEPAAPITTKFVAQVTVTDPDSQLPVELEIRKLASGGMVGIDASWLSADQGPTYSPYDQGIELNIPDNEDHLEGVGSEEPVGGSDSGVG